MILEKKYSDAETNVHIVMMEMYMHYLESAGLKEHILIKNYSSRTIRRIANNL